MPVSRPYVLGPGGGERIALPDRGADAALKAAGEQTGGLFSLVESAPAPGEPGLAPHLHRHSDEALYVLAGRIRVRLGSETLDAPAGSFVYIPRGTVHGFANPGPDPARVLVLFVPAGLEQFLRETAEAYAADSTPAPGALEALRRRHDVELA